MNDTPNNNEEFGSYSLGNVGQPENNDASSLPPLNVDPSPVETLDVEPGMESMSNNPADVASQVGDANISLTPPTEVIPNQPSDAGMLVNNPINNGIPEQNNFVPPLTNGIGAIPPLTNSLPDANSSVSSSLITPVAPPKKGLNKGLFVIIILLALAGVAAGVYFLLLQGSKNNKIPDVIPRDVNIEIGSKISNEISDYVVLNNNVSVNNCTLNTSNIKDTNTLNAEYIYTVSCNGKTYTGNVKIVDTIPPKVEVKKVEALVNSEINPELFITSCDDTTTCTYKFKEEEKVLENLKETGNYKVDIVVTDEAGNATDITANLEVANSISTEVEYLACSKENDGYVDKIKLSVENKKFTKSVIREYIFTPTSSEYEELLKASKSSDKITFKGITGTPTFDDSEKTMTIKITYTYEDINKEFNTTLPIEVSALKPFFNNEGYICKTEK